ncbi:MAG: RagB/SusD family nutrient uptake outer membrane protein [Atribacterota bacterium]|nr:RagB/SusD family nutrient uptake outer membrane protein [Atribacterota bacterium]
MKNYIKILFIATVILSFFSSCDVLDPQNDGRITKDEAFSSRLRIQGYLNDIYRNMRYPGINMSYYSDEAHDSDISYSKYKAWYNGDVSATTFNSYAPDNIWSNYFNGIRKCNIFIEEVAKATDILPDERIAGLDAQARTLRAFFYLQLIKRYGGVPIISDALDPDYDFSQDKRSSFSEVVTFILSDLDIALAAPDTRDGFSWDIYDRQYGIMTRAVAYAIKSQAITYAASPLWTDGTYSWDDATEINKEALAQCLNNDYKLFDLIPDMNVAPNAYAYYFLINSDDRRSRDKETIYRGVNMKIWRDAGLPTTEGMSMAGPSPTQNLVDSYEMANGETPVLGYSDSDNLIPIINEDSGYDSNNPYEGRDPRFLASVFYNGAPRHFGDEEIMIDLDLDLAHINQLTVKKEPSYYEITTTGGDPWVWLSPLANPLPSFLSLKLTFEYQTNSNIETNQLFFGPGLAEARSLKPTNNIIASNEWATHSFDIERAYEEFSWGNPGNYIRFDIGKKAGNVLKIKNIRIKVEVKLEGIETFVGGSEGISESSNRHTSTGYYIRKFNYHNSNVNNDADGEMRTFRLAELYLNFAESAYQSHGPDVNINMGNYTMSARDAINAVRERAGMPPFPIGMSKNDFEKKYRNERRIEFAFEVHRFFDVRRWKIMHETDQFVNGMRIQKDNDLFIYDRFRFNTRTCSTDKYLMYAIDNNEAIKMNQITGTNWQNPGW